MLRGQQRAEPDGDAEGEGQAADGDVGDGTERKPQRRQPVSVTDSRRDHQIGEQRRQHSTGDGDSPDADRRAEHREHRAVAESVMAGEPEVVPHFEAVPLDEADAKEMGGQVRTPPAQHDRHRC